MSTNPNQPHRGNPPDAHQGEITQLLEEALANVPGAEEKLLDHVYQVLRDNAHAAIRGRDGPESQATAWVNQVWERIFHGGAEPTFRNRRAFYGYAASGIRNLLVDYFRPNRPNQLDPAIAAQLVAEYESVGQVDSLRALDEALEILKGENERCAEAVEVVVMKFYGGMKMDDIKDVMNCSKSKVEALWSLAKVKLRRMLENDTALSDET